MAVLGDHDAIPASGYSRNPRVDLDNPYLPPGRPASLNPFEISGEAGGLGIDVAQLIQVVLKHRWAILGCLLCALAIGVAAVLLMTPIFYAETTVKIDRESARIINVEGTEPGESIGANEEFFLTQYGLLKSRSLATAVVERLGLANGDRFFTAMKAEIPTAGPDSTTAGRRRLATQLVQDSLDVLPVRGSRLVEIGFNSPDPAIAADIANAIAEAFIESNLTRRYESADYARQFLEGKLVEAKVRLEASERAASDYATNERLIYLNSGSQDGSGGSQSLTGASLVSANEALSAARAERVRAEQQWRQAQNAAPGALPGVLQNSAIQTLQQSRAMLEAEYQDKLETFKPEFPEMVNLRSRIGEIDRQISQALQNIQSSVRLQYDVALSEEKAFESQVGQLQDAILNVGRRGIQLEILNREADTNRTLYEGLLQRYKEIGVTGGISTNNISIIDRAQAPISPSKPRPLLILALAAMLGLGFGVLVAFLLELLDESIAVPQDLETKLGLPLLGSVPMLAKGQEPLTALRDPRSATSEAYYSIRTTLQFSTPRGVPSSLLITSSRPGEGKSTSALAISRNFAVVGSKVLLIDGDMRKPSMHRLIGVANTQGLSNLLAGALSLQEAAQPTETPNLSFVPCGVLPPNPAELLASDRMQRLLNEALTSYDIVVIDGPPVLGLADAPALAALVEGTVFVVEARGTRRGLARNAVRRLRMGHATVVGSILTKFDAAKASYGYGGSYAYEYNYGASEKA